MSYCGYTSYASQAFAGIQWIPFIVPLVISAAAWTFYPSTSMDGQQRVMKPGKQMILLLFGFWLVLMEGFLYVLQARFAWTHVDPYCVDLITYSFPSRISFYLAVMMTYFVLFSYFWNVEMHWSYWTCIELFFVIPQSMLVWMVYNTWREALVSTLLGIISTAMFLIFYRFLLFDSLPYLTNQRPWTWFSATDTWSEDGIQNSADILIVLNGAEKKIAARGSV